MTAGVFGAPLSAEHCHSTFRQKRGEHSVTAIAPEARPADSSKVLDWIERVGNKVPNPTIMFVYLSLIHI